MNIKKNGKYGWRKNKAMVPASQNLSIKADEYP